MNKKELLDGILCEYFTGYKYINAVEMIKDRLAHDPIFRSNWNIVSKSIKNHELSLEDVLNSVAYSANLSLDEDTGEEAYKWLSLFVENIENDNKIVEY